MIYAVSAVTEYGPQGINQSASEVRVWPSQPQGVVLLLMLAQVAMVDGQTITAPPDKQVLIYCGSILHPLYVLTLQCTAHPWQRSWFKDTHGALREGVVRESCFCTLLAQNRTNSRRILLEKSISTELNKK